MCQKTDRVCSNEIKVVFTSFPFCLYHIQTFVSRVEAIELFSKHNHPNNVSPKKWMSLMYCGSIPSKNSQKLSHMNRWCRRAGEASTTYLLFKHWQKLYCTLYIVLLSTEFSETFLKNADIRHSTVFTISTAYNVHSLCILSVHTRNSSHHWIFHSVFSLFTLLMDTRRVYRTCQPKL